MGRLAAFFKVADVNVQWSLVGREWSVGGGVGGPRDGRGSIFTARCYASAVLATALCPSVCLSQVGVLLKRLNVGSHKQTTPHDSPGTLLVS